MVQERTEVMAGRTHVLLVGTDAPLLEGLAQSLAALGCLPRVARSIGEAREIAIADRPQVAIVDRRIVEDVAAETFSLPLARGGALVLFRTTGSGRPGPLPHGMHRQVLAELTLPLERHRLAALVQSVGMRAQAAGRSPGADRNLDQRAR